MDWCGILYKMDDYYQGRMINLLLFGMFRLNHLIVMELKKWIHCCYWIIIMVQFKMLFGTSNTKIFLELVVMIEQSPFGMNDSDIHKRNQNQSWMLLLINLKFTLLIFLLSIKIFFSQVLKTNKSSSGISEKCTKTYILSSVIKKT